MQVLHKLYSKMHLSRIVSDGIEADPSEKPFSCTSFLNMANGFKYLFTGGCISKSCTRAVPNLRNDPEIIFCCVYVLTENLLECCTVKYHHVLVTQSKSFAERFC